MNKETTHKSTLVKGDAPLGHRPYYLFSNDDEVISLQVVIWNRRGEIDLLYDSCPDCLRYQICFFSNAVLDINGNVFFDWVNWATNLLWPVFKVSEVISTIGDLNAFDTNGVRPLYPPPPQPQPPCPPQPSFFTCLPRLAPHCWISIVQLQWEIPYSYCGLRPTELCTRLFFLRWEIPYSYFSLRATDICIHLFFL